MGSNNKLVQVCLFNLISMSCLVYILGELLLSFHFTKKKMPLLFFIQQPSARMAGVGPSVERTDKASGMSPGS